MTSMSPVKTRVGRTAEFSTVSIGAIIVSSSIKRECATRQSLNFSEDSALQLPVLSSKPIRTCGLVQFGGKPPVALAFLTSRISSTGSFGLSNMLSLRPIRFMSRCSR